MVFYLKYRPQKIKDLDSEFARLKLETILSGTNIPHAFLFTGPKGLGKTSAARLIAKSINCQKKIKDSAEPCNKCKSCISITNGTNLDVIEIDAASNRGIDEIRDLREKVRLSPVSEKKKVYIIDEVHMLTTEAFNALLKTLEEPPAHAVFVLCTTEPHKVPETVASRCLHISFNKATVPELVRSLERIVKGEKLSIDRDALTNIALLSDGSFRDGAKILEEIVGDAGKKKITAKLIGELYKTTSISGQLESLLKALFTKNTKEAIETISQITESGVDIKFFMDRLINRLHDELIQVVEGKAKHDFSLIDMTRLIDLITQSYSELKFSPLPQLPLEIAIIEWGDSSIVTQVSDEPSELTENVVLKTPSKNDKILKELIDAVKPNNFSVAGVLRGCAIEEVDNDSLVISTMYKFHKEKLEEVQVHKLIETTLSKIVGHNIKASFLLKARGGDLNE